MGDLKVLLLLGSPSSRCFLCRERFLCKCSLFFCKPTLDAVVSRGLLTSKPVVFARVSPALKLKLEMDRIWTLPKRAHGLRRQRYGMTNVL